MTAPEPGFDRLRRRVPEGDPGSPTTGDPQGRRALYSGAVAQAPALGAVTVECSDCRQATVVTARGLVRLAMPSVHLPVLRRDHPSWMRCPACGRRTWVRVRL
jgi:hypothetical protein